MGNELPLTGHEMHVKPFKNWHMCALSTLVSYFSVNKCLLILKVFIPGILIKFYIVLPNKYTRDVHSITIFRYSYMFRQIILPSSGSPHTKFKTWYLACLLPYLLTYLLNLLTPWSRVLLEKLTGLQLIKKFPAFYGTRMFITAFTSARHLSLS